ncbi:putative NADPH dehydrogenase C23G7.10c [Daldinia childiae]|uniref:putative NADPH dehydrogenase C23G7.10c n=1 Tax=Daldinia childiae TaxID=326645 RepID=UPI0014465C29|nr:putative NADPH dehydrogenase C23G7.10c [Daldinia childiae]KAF3059702.1 putative NADPH dehydrogenase C23G7.10c [Daldinia childiae]
MSTINGTKVNALSIPNKAAKGVPFFTPAQEPPAGTALDPQPDGSTIPKLFTPLKIRGLTLQNRIMLSPLCQYSAENGFHTFWHLTHLGGIIQRGPGLAMIEATAVQSHGRITPNDSGLWLDDHMEGIKRTVDFAHSQGQHIAIQLAHAGRKASALAPWLHRGATAAADVGGWPDDVVAPSAIPYDENHVVPRALTLEDIAQLKLDFVAAAKRALKIGFDVLELHCAHGYLLHQFLSPVTNHRTDKYGGSFENRARLILELADELRAVMPADMPLFARLSATDWLEGVEGYTGDSWKLEDSVRLSVLLVQHGVDVIDVSSAGNHPLQKIARGPGYQAPFAKAIKRAIGDNAYVVTVGTIMSGQQANDLLVGGKDADDTPVDIAGVGRMFQKNPGLVWTWAEELHVATYVANQIGWGFGGRATKQRKPEPTKEHCHGPVPSS